MAVPPGAPVAIVLAAGKSARLGPDKLLEVVGGVPLIERTVKPYLDSSRVDEVVLVVGKGRSAAFSWLKGLHVHLVENPNEGPMITSIRAGLGSGWAKGRAFLIHPGDVPFVPEEVVSRIAVHLMTRPAKIVIPVYKGLGGHPTGFAADLRDDFFRHGDRDGAREVLLRHRQETVRVNLPEPDICFDVDTPEDLRAAADPGARWARVEAEVEGRAKARLR
jgi:CTP:molybdopterin cytidylyltransferase MocA